ncbi:MAG TPA: tetratricopeptide repeat protein, partial [Terriglobia bacterium]|nr:tetratricopeptide repeat protein [Terriglobia bacterium]
MGFWRKAVIQPALDSETESTVQEQQELLRKEPSNPRAYFALGTLAHLRGETIAAIEHFKKAIELDPAYAAARVSLGRIYAIQGNYELAWQQARAAERSGDSSLIQ